MKNQTIELSECFVTERGLLVSPSALHKDLAFEIVGIAAVGVKQLILYYGNLFYMRNPK